MDAEDEEDGCNDSSGKLRVFALNSVMELTPLRDARAPEAEAWLGGDVVREAAGDYGRLRGLDVLTTREKPGVRIYVKDDSVVLVYVGRTALPEGLTPERLKGEFTATAVESLRSRQGKRGRMSVAAEQGIAWSSLDDEIGWVELFRPRSFEDYQRDIYKTPPKFVQ